MSERETLQELRELIRTPWLGEEERCEKMLAKIDAALASAPQASQPPQGAEPIIGHIQWTSGSEPSPELRAAMQDLVTKAWQALKERPDFIAGYHAGLDDGQRCAERAALAAPPQGASSRWTEQAAVDLAQRAGFSGTCWTMGPYELVHMLNMAASPLPAPQEPAKWHGLTEGERDKIVGDIIGYGTEFVGPLYAVVYGIERVLMERNAAPAPVDPESQGSSEPPSSQGAEAGLQVAASTLTREQIANLIDAAVAADRALREQGR